MSVRRRSDFARFYEEVGRSYPEEEVVYRDLRGRLRRKFILDWLGDKSGWLLDIGCNAGGYLCEWRGPVGVGVDLSHAVLQRGRRHCSERGAGSRFYWIVGDAQQLDFLRPNRFDVVLCSEVLEHLTEPEAVFRGVAAVLRPGGQALFTTPNYKKSRPEWVPLGELADYVAGEEYYHTAYRPEELRGFATKAGLHVKEAGTIEWEVKYAARLPALAKRFLDGLNRMLFRSRKFERLIQRGFEQSTIFFYRIGHTTGIEKILRPLIREGVRSYIIVEKRE